jgi:phosphopantothenoylcysteine decarboxylase/phosphopantothenate--cysteine ligase
MSEPEEIVRAAEALLSPHDLTGVRLVVTAGPTQEGVDPVRYLTNRSSGTMGFRVAERAAARGATVTLIAGPVSKPTPHGVTRVDVTDALSMNEALAIAMKTNLCGADALVMAAAVSDYRPASMSAQKLKRGDGPKTLELVPNPDLLASVGASRKGARPLLIGFALETADGADLVALAREKLSRKKVDMVVANPASVALGGETSRAFLVTRESAEEVGPADKRVIADRILDAVRDRLADKRGAAA